MAGDFRVLIKAAIVRMRERHQQSMEDLAARVGVSAPALYRAMSATKGTVIGYDTAMRIADEAELTDDERFDLEAAWLQTRISTGALGRVFQVMSAELRRAMTKPKYREAMEKILDEYRGKE